MGRKNRQVGIAKISRGSSFVQLSDAQENEQATNEDPDAKDDDMDVEDIHSLLYGIKKYSTNLGKLWLLVMLLFRVMVLAVAGRRVWKDDQGGFSCNTEQPGCVTVCFDQFFPISQLRLWTLQMLLVSCPAVFIALHIKYKKAEKPSTEEKAEKPSTEEISVEKMPGCMFCVYVSSVFCRIGLELGFTVLFYHIYGGFTLSRIMTCSESPCPNSVECYVTRPSEKNVITYFMITSSIFCLLVSTAELVYITINRFLRVMWKIPPSSRKAKAVQVKRPKEKTGELCTSPRHNQRNTLCKGIADSHQGLKHGNCTAGKIHELT